LIVLAQQTVTAMWMALVAERDVQLLLIVILSMPITNIAILMVIAMHVFRMNIVAQE